jgi:hypothetical protein
MNHQYEVRIKSKTSNQFHSVNITCGSAAKAIFVASQEYQGFDFVGVVATRKAHYFYNEIDASE